MSVSVDILRPMWLLGLLAIPILVMVFYRSLVDFSRAQRVASLVTRSLIVVLMVLALCGTQLEEPTERQCVVFAIDRSKSLGDESRLFAKQFVEESRAHQAEHRSFVLEFGKSPGAVESETSIAEEADIDPMGTDIASALELAAASMPPFHVPHIVLLSDGNETVRDALSVAQGLEGVTVSTVPLESRRDPEVQLSSVDVPTQVRQGEPFDVAVRIHSNFDDEVSIDIFRGPHKIASERKRVSPGENTFTFRQVIKRERVATFTAEVYAESDTLRDNNRHSGIVYARGKPRVLMIDQSKRRARDLMRALDEEGLEVEFRPAAGMPDDLADLQNFELLILSNVPALELGMARMDVLRTWVQDLGGGLLMLGGDQSFGLGGYYKSVIEDILPVRSDFEKKKEKPSLAMALILDKSGSMGGQKIELAKDASKGAVELLGPRDQVGVIAFDAIPYWVCQMHPCTDKAYVLDRVASVRAGGGTSLHPAMEQGLSALSSTVAKLKHVILLTDGRSSPGDFEGVTRQMAAARITVSTVALGQGADRDLLQEIARWGGGRHYFTDDPTSIPQIFAKETITASQSGLREEPFLPIQVRPTTVLAGLDMDDAPLLLGYVVTRAKATSEVILATEDGHPLLAWWRYGLGMTVAFTSDASSRWAVEWLSWSRFSRFWAQVARHAMRKNEAEDVETHLSRDGDDALVVVDALAPSGGFLNAAETEMTLITPDLQKRQETLPQTAPGRYESRIEVREPGAYHLELVQQHEGVVVQRQSRGLVVGYPEELRIRATDHERLRALADATGGVHDMDVQEVFQDRGRRAQRVTPLHQELLAIAILLFLVDVALRRLDLSSRRKQSVS